MTADPARRAAYDVVLGVERDQAYANLVLPRLLRERGLGGTDARFATELGYGTLRWQGTLDAVIAHAARRQVDSLDPPVRAVLRLGAYQLLHTRVPAHAAVSTTVDLAKAVGSARASGLVNAVMRRVGERDWPGWVDTVAPREAVERLAFECGYPGWIAAAWLDALGGDRQELGRALALDRPATHLLARPGRITRDALLAAAGEGATAGPFSPYAVRLAGGDPSRIGPVQDGRAGVQDEGSQLVALALIRLPLEGPDARWLDLCAGPGGKSGLLAGVLPPAGRLVANDVQPHRAALVTRGVAGTATTVIVGDGTSPAWRVGSFDRVLVDAPCTGLGALRRRPEVRWRRQPADVDRLATLQRALLDAALDSARPGGLVVYATCSPHPAETTEVVRAVLERRSDARSLDTSVALPDVPEVGGGPHVQLWPHRHGTDAMFVAALERTT